MTLFSQRERVLSKAMGIISLEIAVLFYLIIIDKI